MEKAADMTVGHRVVIGVPLYNHDRHLPETLESFLLQTYRDFSVVLVDDCSTDRTESIARAYAAADGRLFYQRNQRRLGYIDNARRVFSLSLQQFPRAEYFAWGSDHDVWHPCWLGALVRALDSAPQAVLAWSWVARIGDQGEFIRKPKYVAQFDSTNARHPLRRFKMTIAGMSAGNMVYGLGRVAALRRTGTLHHVLEPDSLLMAELSFFGAVVQVPEILWYRRYIGTAKRERQVKSLFPDGSPWHAWLPTWLTHATLIALDYGLRGKGRPEVFRSTGLLATGIYAGIKGVRSWRSLFHRLLLIKVRRRMRRVLKFSALLRGAARRTRVLSWALSWRKSLSL